MDLTQLHARVLRVVSNDATDCPHCPNGHTPPTGGTKEN